MTICDTVDQIWCLTFWYSTAHRGFDYRTFSTIAILADKRIESGILTVHISRQAAGTASKA